jgi:hypothetical protein
MVVVPCEEGEDHAVEDSLRACLDLKEEGQDVVATTTDPVLIKIIDLSANFVAKRDTLW